MIEQIYKSKNITVSRDMDPNNNDPHTCTIIEEHTDDKKVILDDLIAEIQKPYSFKLDWWIAMLMILNITSTISSIYTGKVDLFIILNWFILLWCVHIRNKTLKLRYTSKTLVLLFTICKIDGQV